MPDAVDLKQDAHRKRIIVGVLAIGMALVALWLNVIDRGLGEEYAAFQSGSVRMTAMLAVLWLALPDASKIGPKAWLVVCALIAAIFLVRGKMFVKLLVPAIAVLSTLAYLRRFTAALTGKPPNDRRPS